MPSTADHIESAVPPNARTHTVYGHSPEPISKQPVNGAELCEESLQTSTEGHYFPEPSRKKPTRSE